MSAFRGAGGKVSMTRIAIFILAIDASVLAGALAKYLLGDNPSAAVVAAVGGVVGAYVAGGCVALAKRSRAAKTEQEGAEKNDA